MGFDITYHPIAEDELRTFWFDLLVDRNKLSAMKAAVAQDEGAGDYIASLVKSARRSKRRNLNLVHLFPLAIVAGIVRPYWYLRGGAFSFCIEQDPRLERYVVSLRTLVPAPFRSWESADTLEGDSTVGCYIPERKVGLLLSAIRRKQISAATLAPAFSHGRLPVFVKALEAALKQQRGLLEVEGVVVPEPFEEGFVRCLTNADHCRRQGLTLYRKAAAGQMRKAALLLRQAERGSPAGAGGKKRA